MAVFTLAPAPNEVHFMTDSQVIAPTNEPIAAPTSPRKIIAASYIVYYYSISVFVFRLCYTI